MFGVGVRGRGFGVSSAGSGERILGVGLQMCRGERVNVLSGVGYKNELFGNWKDENACGLKTVFV